MKKYHVVPFMGLMSRRPFPLVFAVSLMLRKMGEKRTRINSEEIGNKCT